MKKVIFIVLLISVFAVTNYLSYQEGYKNSMNSYYDESIYSSKYWEDFKQKEPINRVSPCFDPNVLEYLISQNKGKDIKEKLSFSNQEQKVIEQLLNAIDKWPSNVSTYFWNHVAHIYIVDGLYSSGMADCMDDKDTFIIFLNKNILTKSPNTWITETEESSFKYQDEVENLEIKIEESDSTHLTAENIIIHELGHIVSLNKTLIPDWRTSLNINHEYCSDEFKLRLRLDRKSKTDYLFNTITYYANDADKIEFNEYLDLTLLLEQTTYPTLYGATDNVEYFAELFYSHFHCNIQNRPYIITFTTNNYEKTIFQNGLLMPRCEIQKIQFDQLINEL